MGIYFMNILPASLVWALYTRPTFPALGLVEDGYVVVLLTSSHQIKPHQP